MHTHLAAYIQNLKVHTVWMSENVCVSVCCSPDRSVLFLSRSSLVKSVLENSSSPAVAHCAQPARTHLHPLLIKLNVLMKRAPINSKPFHIVNYGSYMKTYTCFQKEFDLGKGLD